MTSPAPNQPYSIRFGDLLPRILERAADEGQGKRGRYSITETVRRDLQRHYQGIEDTLRRVEFSRQEWCLMADACNGTAWLDGSERYLWAEIADAVRLNHLDRKWEVDNPDGLVRRLQALSYTETVAIVDVIERFWALVGTDGEVDSPVELIREAPAR